MFIFGVVESEGPVQILNITVIDHIFQLLSEILNTTLYLHIVILLDGYNAWVWLITLDVLNIFELDISLHQLNQSHLYR